MQKKIIIRTLPMIFTIFLIIFVVTNNPKSFVENGVTYAVTLDGTNINYFPSKGLYQVAVDCDNATGKWLYDDWKLVIEDITNNVSCSIDFNTISKTYLNDYIIGLTGKIEGAGEVVNETFSKGNYSSAVSLSSSQYLSQSQYTATSHSSTSGTPTSVFNFSNSKWSTNASSLTSGTYYHFQFSIPSAGYYQVCYTISSGHSYNYLYFYKNTSQLYASENRYIAANSSNTNEGCYEIGYLTTTDNIRIVQRAYYYSESYPISSMSFNVQLTTNTQNIDAGYRYEGKNPNNYVSFNNELWRIIGVFDATSHGQPGEKLVKIIRDNSIGGYVYDLKYKSNYIDWSNDWTESILQLLLNGPYYNALDGTESGYCYKGYDIVGDCDYRIKGIQDNYRGMVRNVTWYLGDYYTASANVNTFYERERSSSIYGTNPASFNAYIGLMYPSDYGYSVLASSCDRTTNLSSYSTTSCANQNWMFGHGNEWAITPFGYVNNDYDDYTFGLNESGRIGLDFSTSSVAGYGFNTRPVLYLNSNVYILDGNGSSTNPYILGI